MKVFDGFVLDTKVNKHINSDIRFVIFRIASEASIQTIRWEILSERCNIR